MKKITISEYFYKFAFMICKFMRSLKVEDLLGQIDIITSKQLTCFRTNNPPL